MLLTVSQNKENAFHSINEALDKANDNDKIFIEGGVYNESIVISKNIELQGDENDIPIITIESGIVCEVSSCSSFSFIHFDNSNGVLPEDEDVHGLNALVKIGCSATFNNCQFTSSFDANIKVFGENTEGHFINCSISDSNRNGMLFAGGAIGVVENCKIFNTGFHGISIVNSTVDIKNCDIHDVQGSGIYSVGNCSDIERLNSDVENPIMNISKICITDTKICNVPNISFDGIFIGDDVIAKIENCNISNIDDGFSIMHSGDNNYLDQVVIKNCKVYNDNCLYFEDNEEDGALIFSASKNDGFIFNAEENPCYVFEDNKLYNKDKTYLIKNFDTSEHIDVISSVTRICKTAFCSNPSLSIDLDAVNLLSSINLPSSLKAIDYGAFFGCSALEKIDIPSTVTSIGKKAFAFCPALEEVTIPEGVENIPEYLFTNCTFLSNINLPSTIKTIEKGAFQGCENLENIKLPKDIKVLSSNCFNSCSSLTSIDIPLTVESIEECAFAFSGLESITIPEGVKKLGANCFNSCESLTSIVLPSSLETIEEGAFAYAPLESIIIPEGVKKLSPNLFNGCASLTSIVLPSTLESIEDYAFADCTSLESITIPEGVKYLGSNSFNNCTSLTFIVIPSTVETIEEEAFRGCSSLERIKLPMGITQLADGLFINCTSLNNVRVPSSVECINYCAFQNCESLKNITLHEGLKLIGSGAFNNCMALESIEIPSTVKFIRNSVFQGCTYLTNVNIPMGVTQLSDNLFTDCPSLKSIEIPSTVETLAEGIFTSCQSLENVTLPSTIKYLPDNLFNNCTSLKEIDIPSTVEIIGKNTFANCESLENIILPKNLKELKQFVFQGCKSLKNIDIPSTVETIGELAFGDCSALESINLPKGLKEVRSSLFYSCSSLKEIVIPPTVEIIGTSVFSDCSNLENITLPPNLKVLSESLFHNCTSLKEIELPSNLEIIESNAFSGCSSLKRITLPLGVKSIGEAAFAGCSSIESITIPEGVKVIEGNAFSSCDLKEVEISSTVEKIGETAFSFNENLKSIVIPDSVTFIGNDAFYGCRSLEDIYLSENLTSIEKETFSHCVSLGSVSIPYGVTRIKEEAFGNCFALTYIYIPDTVTSIEKHAFSGTSLENIRLSDNLEYVNFNMFDKNYYNDIEIDLAKYYPYQLDEDIKNIALIPNLDTLLDCEMSQNQRDEWTKFFRSIIFVCREILFEDFLKVLIQFNSIYVEDLKAFLEMSAKNDDVNLSAFLVEYEHTHFSDEEIRIVNENEFDLDIDKYSVLKIGEKYDNLSVLKYIGYDKDIIIPDSLYEMPIVKIDDKAFSVNQEFLLDEMIDARKNIRSIEIPNSVTCIGNKVFEGLKNLESIVFPDSVESIGEDTINEIVLDCRKLKSIKLPEGVTSLPAKAFSYYTCLEEIYLPSTLKEIGSDAFSFSLNIQSVTISSENKYFYVEDGIIYSKENNEVVCYVVKNYVSDSENKAALETFDDLSSVFEENSAGGASYIYEQIGLWPQSLKKDDVVVNEKNVYHLAGFDCYKGSDQQYYVKQESNIDDELYEYSSEECVFKNKEKIEKNTFYFFKIEGIKWINGFGDDNLMISKDILFPHCFYKNDKSTIREDIENNDYKYSSIRALLNGLDGSEYNVEDFRGKGFIDRAFTDKQKNKIDYFNEDGDKVSLLNKEEAEENDYDNFYKSVTDWAKAIGCSPEKLWLRSHEDFYEVSDSVNTLDINISGYISDATIDNDAIGVAPAIRMKD